MKKIVLVLVCFISVLCSCKEKEPEPKAIVVEKEKTPSVLKVIIDYKSDTDDVIQFLFAQIELDGNQNGTYILNENISSSDNFTKKEFKMFGDYIPLIAQLKLGPKPKNMIINNILISYEENEIIIRGEDLDKYFRLNDFITYDAENKTLATISKNGKSLPHLTLQRGYINKLFGLN